MSVPTGDPAVEGWSAGRPVRTEYRVDGLPAPVSHYTDAVRWGDLLFVSGLFAVDQAGSVIAPGDVEGQTAVVLDYLSTVLGRVGAALADVLHLRLYLVDINDRGRVNEVRKQAFGDHRPASTLVEVSALALDGLLVEIDAIAAVP